MRILKFLAAALILSSSPLPAEKSSRDLRLLEIKGDVWIKPPGADWEQIPEDAVSVPLEEGEAVKTGAGAEATLQLDKENTIELSEKTEFEISSTKLAWSRFRLNMGRIFAKIEEKLDQRRRRMVINTHTAVLAVRGTEFLVDIPGGDKEGGVAVFEGTLEASASENAETIKIEADKEADLTAQGPARLRALKRFAAHKRRMMLIRKKHARLKSQWRNIPMERRQAIRSKIKHRTNQRRKEIEKRRDKGQKGRP